MRSETHTSDEPSDTRRLDRNMAEVLQELRVAEVGVQILFVFLLTLPFSKDSRTSMDRSAGSISPLCCWPPVHPVVHRPDRLPPHRLPA